MGPQEEFLLLFVGAAADELSSAAVQVSQFVFNSVRLNRNVIIHPAVHTATLSSLAADWDQFTSLIRTINHDNISRLLTQTAASHTDVPASQRRGKKYSGRTGR